MSFCEKHTNHHCIHAHNCRDPSHKAERVGTGIMGSTSKTQKRNMKESKNQLANNQQECNFDSLNRDLNHLTSAEIIKSLEAKVKLLQNTIENSRREILETNAINEKLKEENRQCQGVIQYYREEMDRIVKCSDEDVKNIIKNGIKENSELKAQNKVLSSKVRDLQNLLDENISLNEEAQRKINSLIRENEEIGNKYNQLFDKFRKLHSEDKLKESDLTVEKRKILQVEQKYKILLEESKNSYQKVLNDKKKLESENKVLKVELETLKRQLKSNENLYKIEEESWQERESVYKKKLSQNKTELENTDKRISELEMELKLKEEELIQSTRLLQKQLQLIKNNKELYEQLEKDEEERERLREGEGSVDGSPSKGTNINNEYTNSGYLSNRVKQIEKENAELRQKLNSSSAGGGVTHIHNNQTIEEYILNVGASEAFKKIIEEKNAYIKKLIREKGELYSRI